MAKQYGLITRDKGKVITRPSIFNEDSDSNDGQDKPTGITALKKKERMAQQKAEEEDPTIYQYDELYDDMQSKRKESKLARKDLDRKPKYINKLLETAERRKKEYERRIERDVQKEREAEGDLYKDKESFVTSAYRKKLEEIKELEEKEKREEYLESIGDVKKQGDLSGFYRHLYAQQVNYDENAGGAKSSKKNDEETSMKSEDKSEDSEETFKKHEVSKVKEEQSKVNEDQEESVSSSRKMSDSKKRKYRKHEHSKSSEDESGKEEDKKLHHLQSNLDADSDFSIDSDSDSDSESEPKKKKTDKPVPSNETKEENKTSEVNAETSTEMKDSVKVEDNEDDSIKTEEKVSPEEPVVPKKPKIDIWKKRTVGEVFDDALKRYYERKSARMQAVN